MILSGVDGKKKKKVIEPEEAMDTEEVKEEIKEENVKEEAEEHVEEDSKSEVWEKRSEEHKELVSQLQEKVRVRRHCTAFLSLSI